MDNHHELQFDESEQTRIKSSCVLDSENRKVSILNSKDNVYGNGIIDINRNNIVNKTSGSEINQTECLDQMEALSGSYKQLANMRNETNHGDKDLIIEDRKRVDDVVLNIFGPPDDSYESVEDEDKNFVLGDIVWVMMKTKLWWPGFISEPSSKAPKKFIYKDYFLVKLYSNPSSVWASSFEVKEFTLHFDEMIKQDDSRTFNAAIDRAVNEITCHIKKELTCSCFQNPCPPKNLELKSFALSRFQPDKFLTFIKHLAVDVNVSKKIDITVTKNVVCAFYRSLGHRQLQNHQFSPSRNSTRKRSRIELNSGTNEPKSIKKGLGKCIYGSSVVDIAKIVNLSAKEMFDDLCCVAVNGSTSKERRYFGPLKRFFSCFRNFAFSKDEGTIDSTKLEKLKAENEADLDFSNIKPKKKRQKKINLNSESKDSSAVVNEGQLGLDETNGKKNLIRKNKKLVFSEANTASRIPDLNSNIYVPSVGSFPIIGQHAMSSAMPFYGGFPSTGHAMPSVGGIQGTRHAMSSVVGGVQGTGHAMPSVVGGVQGTGHAMPSVVGGVQGTGHAMSSIGGVQGTGQAMQTVGGVQGTGHAMSSVGGFQSSGHAMPFYGGFPGTGHAMPSVGGVQSTGHAMSSVGGIHGVGYAMSSLGGVQSTGHAVSSVGGIQSSGHAMSSVGGGLRYAVSSVGSVHTTGHAMSSVGGVHTTGNAMSSFGAVHSTGHAMSSIGVLQSTRHAMQSIGGVQITGQQQPNVQVENDVNLTKMEQAFINSGVGWLDSNGNSMTFVQLLNDVEGGKNSNFFQSNFGSPLFPNQISFVSQGSFPRPIEANHINFVSQSQPKNAIAIAPELKRKRNRKPKVKPSIVVSSPLPDLNGSFAESNPIANSNQQKIKPPRKSKKKSVGDTLHQHPSRSLLPINGFKPVMLSSPPGFAPPRVSKPPDLAFIKHKLEMMKSTMEKAGNSLTPEMKLKLENEISGFSTKVNSMFGSSSS